MMMRLLAVVVAVVAAAGPPTTADAASFTSRESGPWSDPATWGGVAVGTNVVPIPGPGDQVFIASGTRIILDEGAPSIAVDSLSIQRGAVLTCPPSVATASSSSSSSSSPSSSSSSSSSTPSPGPNNAPLDLVLQVSLLRVESGGCFSCGHGDCTSTLDAEPFQGTFTLRLRSNSAPASADDNVRTIMVEDGGGLFLHGASRVVPVVRLDEDANVGQTRLSGSASTAIMDDVAASVSSSSWRVGDRVVIAPTDWHPDHAEYHTILGIEPLHSASTTIPSHFVLTIADALKYARNGRRIQLTNRADGDRRVDVDARAEIALLSRNIVIEGANDAAGGLGGDLMMVGSNTRVRLQWVEIRRMGRRGHLGRYPLHIHNMGDGGSNVHVANVAIHSSYQRGIVVHCTNGVTLINNTVAGTHGFGYMLEDGAEENNVLIGNYAIDIRPSALTAALIQTERVNPAGFWFVNPANTFQGNVAAGVAGAGFSWDLDLVLANRPATLTTCRDALPRVGYVDADLNDDPSAFNRAVYTALMRKRFVKFEDNTAHSAFSGLWITFPFIDAEEDLRMAGWQGGGGGGTAPNSTSTVQLLPRQVPITRFTAWKIGFRRFVSGVDLTDGVKLVFEACVHMRNPRRMRIDQLTCVNAQNAAWSTMAASYNGATIGWLSERELKPSGAPSPVPSALGGAVLAYMEPQCFARTHLFGNIGMFSTAFMGQRMSALNILHSLSVDENESSSTPAAALISLLAGDVQVFTDETGDAFGAGPGAVVAAPCAQACAGQLDPLLEVHARGRCTAAAAAAAVAGAVAAASAGAGGFAGPPPIARGVLPSGRIIAARGGDVVVPVLCYGGNQGDPVRFAVLNLNSAMGGTDRRSLAPSLEVQIEAIVSGAGVPQSRRMAESHPMLVPLTASAMAIGGGYRLVFTRVQGSGVAPLPTALNYVDVSLGPTSSSEDGMTLVLSGVVVGSAGLSHVGGSASDLKLVNGTTRSCAMQLADPALGCRRRPPSDGSNTNGRHVLPRICACRALDVPGGEITVRFNAAPQPQYFGLFTAEGAERALYTSGRLRVFL
jgi:hypothetical protein